MKGCPKAAFRMRRTEGLRAARGWLLAALFVLSGVSATAQESDVSGTQPGEPVTSGPSETTIIAPSPILVIDQDRLFDESAFGRRVRAEVEAASAEAAAESRKIEAQLTAEEKSLTERRPDLTPEEFRDLADAFDKRVTKFRDEQAEKASAIAAQQEAERKRFLDVALPVLGEIVRDNGAVAMLEKRSVFLSARSIDVTDRAIAAIDARIGDGILLPDQGTVPAEDDGQSPPKPAEP
ncbi:MAG: OmpH family outer membrane protein [Paracoccaceae bacterium]